MVGARRARLKVRDASSTTIRIIQCAFPVRPVSRQNVAKPNCRRTTGGYGFSVAIDLAHLGGRLSAIRFRFFGSPKPGSVEAKKHPFGAIWPR